MEDAAKAELESARDSSAERPADAVLNTHRNTKE